MKRTAAEFLERPRKSITLMGMSGIGKTYLARRLKDWGWSLYSCDYEIGKKYLGNEIVETLSKQTGRKIENTVTFDNLSLISQYVGKLGNPAKGGLTLPEFKRRQKKYYNAECEALRNLESVLLDKSHFVNDSTGSLCEIQDEAVLRGLGEKTLVIYIKSDEENNQKVLERARQYPKPLFFPPSRFDEWLKSYMAEHGFASTDQIEPDDFSRWVFPHLFESRLPKYQKIADLYGVTIPAEKMSKVSSQEEFIKSVSEALDG